MHQPRYLTCALFSTILGLYATLAQADETPSSFSVAVHTPKAAQPPSPNTKVDPKNQVTLQRQKGSTSSRYTKALAQGNGAPEVQGTYGTSTLKAVESGTSIYELILSHD